METNTAYKKLQQLGIDVALEITLEAPTIYIKIYNDFRLINHPVDILRVHLIRTILGHNPIPNFG